MKMPASPEHYGVSTPSSKDILEVKEFKEKEIFSNQTMSVVYHIQEKSIEIANAYAETGQISHRYLAYRDLPKFLNQYVKGNSALDYGTGPGLSASYLNDLGFSVIGVDINSTMLQKARDSFPHLNFIEIEKLDPAAQFDFLFSSFVLFDMKSKNEIIQYMKKGLDYLKNGGIFIAIVGSEELYSISRKWLDYDSNFEENRNLDSGDITKIRLKNPSIEFLDYYWKETDYIECFRKLNFKILHIHKPLGHENDPYLWEDERFFSPFTIYILEK